MFLFPFPSAVVSRLLVLDSCGLLFVFLARSFCTRSGALSGFLFGLFLLALWLTYLFYGMADSGDLKRHRRKRKSKCIKAAAERFRYVLGHDIFLDRVSTLCSRALIGRLEYCKMDKLSWVSWATENWKPLFDYVPTISLLSRGWIVFVFLDPIHCTRVLDRMWRAGKGSLVLG